MKLIEPRPHADPEVAARKLVEIASTIEPVQNGEGCLVLDPKRDSPEHWRRLFSSEKSGRSSYHMRVIGPRRRSRGLLPCRYDGRS